MEQNHRIGKLTLSPCVTLAGYPFICSLIQAFTHSFNKYILSICSVSVTVLGPENLLGDKTDVFPTFLNHSLEKKEKFQTKNYFTIYGFTVLERKTYYCICVPNLL